MSKDGNLAAKLILLFSFARIQAYKLKSHFGVLGMQQSGVYLSNNYFYLVYVKHCFLYSQLCQMKWYWFIALCLRPEGTNIQVINAQG